VNRLKWGDFSTLYSIKAIQKAREYDLDLHETGQLIHDYWILAQMIAEKQLDYTNPFLEDYTREKAESHQEMLVPYKELSFDDQVKDLYLFYVHDTKRFMSLEGAKEIVGHFPRVITWVNWM
jgi:hypothetical protein